MKVVLIVKFHSKSNFTIDKWGPCTGRFGTVEVVDIPHLGDIQQRVPQLGNPYQPLIQISIYNYNGVDCSERVRPRKPDSELNCNLDTMETEICPIRQGVPNGNTTT